MFNVYTILFVQDSFVYHHFRLFTFSLEPDASIYGRGKSTPDRRKF